METLYVQKVYDEIGERFDKSRYKPWEGVMKFLDTLKSESNVLDAGCGNGKNMLYRKDLQFIGCDISKTLLDICKSKKLDVIMSNIINLPFKNDTFDAIICVAVLHHLSSYERRRQAVNEMLRVLKPGGQLFIEVWAAEQKLGRKFIKIDDKSKEHDYFVTWEGDQRRYYHLFDRNEIEKMFIKMFINADIRFEKDNWQIIITK